MDDLIIMMSTTVPKIFSIMIYSRLSIVTDKYNNMTQYLEILKGYYGYAGV